MAEQSAANCRRKQPPLSCQNCLPDQGDGQINEDGGQLLGAITGPTLSPRHAAAHERRSYVLFAVGLPLLVPASPSVGQPRSSLMIWGFGAQSDPNSVHGKVGLKDQWLAPGSSSTSSWRS
ncbi:hypothetical protein MGU_04672 [Metarhizium guizhouense ARSEF 977]|uniref:Uncharacterized protein n=1 Tax=Metarhizium guizhouense (strain ARSEF 977) TaxID=1276136 RepID=A0A0B4H887_METGA|nr:hypothetical protein MGU_04672 [Metarhizium guizhouense ARSEF 977]